MREKNIFKIMAWLIKEELKEVELKSFLISLVSFVLSLALFLLIFRR